MGTLLTRSSCHCDDTDVAYGYNGGDERVLLPRAPTECGMGAMGVCSSTDSSVQCAGGVYHQ